MATLLFVDDEPSICWGLSELGKRMRHQVLSASSAEEGLQLAGERQPDAILLDVRLPGMDGLTALPRLKQLVPNTQVVIMTAHGDLNTAVEAVRHGAFDYVAKPFDLKQIEQVIQRALAQPLPSPAAPPAGVQADGLIGRAPAMQEIFKRIALVAPSAACVMLQGDSGTGKELVARAIHRYGRQNNGPFVAVNVAALNPALAESELFGHVRGAFTGAEQARHGLLVQANGGTLFLDEVADIPLPVQIKLLRALEHGEVLPVGSNQPVATQFRLLTATHRNLIDLVRAGEFRHDLYYRLATFQIDLPPLRDRAGDISLLADHFLQQFFAKGSAQSQLSQSALEELQSRPWHGNVRELRNAIEHALILAQGAAILPEHLPPPIPNLQPLLPPAPAADASREEQLAALLQSWTAERLRSPNSSASLFDELLAQVEPPFLQAVMKKHHCQCALAARVLGIHRTTLKKKLDQYGIAAQDD